MRSLNIKIAAFFFFFIYLAVGSQAQTKEELQQKYKKSLEKWQAVKKACNNSYTYTLTHGTIWEDLPTYMDVTVENGVVMKTVLYKAKWGKNSKEPQKLNPDSQLQKEFFGVAVGTIDDIYQYAVDHVFTKDLADFSIYFDTDKNGIVNSAGQRYTIQTDTGMEGYHVFNLKY